MPPAGAQARLEPLGGGRYALSGELDLDNVAALLAEGERAFRGQAAVEVDLGGVTTSDSAGLALLLEWVAAVRSAGGQLHYRALPPQLAAIARLGGVADLLPVTGTAA